MPNLSEKLKEIWNNIQGSPAQIPLTAEISRDHVFPGVSDEEIRADKHYFMVRVNEMFLSKARNWFNLVDPMVFFVSEFTYDSKEIAVPYVIGPGLMEKYGKAIPEGMIFSNTTVAGLHPYKGNELTLSVILYENTRKNYAREFLKVVESISNAIDFSNTLSQYLKVGDVVADGVSELMGLGGTIPLVGYRKSYNPNAGDKISSGFFTLINNNGQEIDPQELWVINDQLYIGDTKEKAKPFREVKGMDFVLYSLMIRSERNDISSLSFYPLYKSMIKSAMESDTQQKWEAAKAEMMTLAKEIRFHPDIAKDHYRILRDKYVAEMAEEHNNAIMDSERSVGKMADMEENNIMNILNL